ncbi:MAG: gliding motility-associated ABC transporter permease subunit GldF [Chitinophagales bacterium]|jgi:ABC-2 type transport system permease protein|nr:gliding motility-associated ABC transporter permease subunit GldF [Chitinophagales bacterium]
MIPIFRKEITAFFSSLIGYIAIAVFLILIGLIMWVFQNNALNNGYATLDILFDNAPIVFMLLIPAVTMRMFSEEKKSGTLEILATRPVSETQIILGKYLAAVCLVIFSLLPTLIYYFTISKLGSPPGNLDTGATWGSYIGLLLLGSSFVAIGLFSSSITDNQIVAFILGAFICFVCYLAFDALSGLGLFGGKGDYIIQSIGIQHHYESISRGVLDLSRDVIYFLSVILIFTLCTKTALESRKW